MFSQWVYQYSCSLTNRVFLYRHEHAVGSFPDQVLQSAAIVPHKDKHHESVPAILFYNIFLKILFIFFFTKNGDSPHRKTRCERAPVVELALGQVVRPEPHKNNRNVGDEHENDGD